MVQGSPGAVPLIYIATRYLRPARAVENGLASVGLQLLFYLPWIGTPAVNFSRVTCLIRSLWIQSLELGWWSPQIQRPMEALLGAGLRDITEVVAGNWLH